MYLRKKFGFWYRDTSLVPGTPFDHKAKLCSFQHMTHGALHDLCVAHLRPNPELYLLLVDTEAVNKAYYARIYIIKTISQHPDRCFVNVTVHQCNKVWGKNWIREACQRCSHVEVREGISPCWERVAPQLSILLLYNDGYGSSGLDLINHYLTAAITDGCNDTQASSTIFSHTTLFIGWWDFLTWRPPPWSRG